MLHIVKQRDRWTKRSYKKMLIDKGIYTKKDTILHVKGNKIFEVLAINIKRLSRQQRFTPI